MSSNNSGQKDDRDSCEGDETARKIVISKTADAPRSTTPNKEIQNEAISESNSQDNISQFCKVKKGGSKVTEIDSQLASELAKKIQV
jgi:hypothetical protein